MSKINKIFENKKTFVGYLTAGDGGVARTLSAMHAMVRGGVDILEVGVPFSDPVADGPTIQDAANRAIKKGVSLYQILQMISQFKQHADTPVILFSYFNPIYQATLRNPNFYQEMKNNGVDGCLIVDLPLEEIDQHYQQCITHQIDPIFLISPSTPKDRIALIAQKARGMLYYVCRKGTTGAKHELPTNLPEKIAEIKSVTNLPLVVGFGVSNIEMAKAICERADGFVVGSAIVDAISKGISEYELVNLVNSLNPKKIFQEAAS